MRAQRPDEVLDRGPAARTPSTGWARCRARARSPAPASRARRAPAPRRAPTAAKTRPGTAHRVRVEGGEELVDGVARVQPGRDHRGPLADAVAGHRVRHDAQRRSAASSSRPTRDDADAVPADVAARPTSPSRSPGRSRACRDSPKCAATSSTRGSKSASRPGKTKAIRPAVAAEQRLRGEPDVVAAAPGAALRDDPAGQREPLRGRVDDAEPGAARRPRGGASRPAARTVGVVGGEQVGQRCRRVARRAAAPARCSGARDRVRPRRAGAGRAAAVRRLLQHHVRVDAAEAEGVDAARRGAVAGLPGLRRGERCGTGCRPAPGCGSSQCSVGSRHRVVHGERGLDQPGHAGGRHGVADHRLHRADRPPALARPPAGPNTSASVASSAASPAGVAVPCASSRPSEPGRGGSRPAARQARRTARAWPPGSGLTRLGGAAVAGHAGAADHRVDPVAVAFGVGEPLEHDDAGALADQDAVGAAVERPDALARRQRAELGEDAPQGDVVAVVHAAGEHQRRSARRPARATAWSTAISEDAQAASTVYAGPRRSSRLAMREAARLGTRPIAASGRSGPSCSVNASRTRSSWPAAEAGQQLAEGPHELVARCGPAGRAGPARA